MKNIATVLFITPLCCLLLACSATNNVSYTPQKKMSAEQLRKDVQVMEHTLRNNHPSLYWYASDTVIHASFQRAYGLLSDSMNEIEFKNLISETLFPIRCGHTSVRFSRRYYQYMDGKRSKSFPLGLKIVDDSTLVVTGALNRRDSSVKQSATILSVDAMNARTIIDTLLPMVSIDGNSKNFSYQNLSNSFPTYFNNRMGVKNQYQIVYLDAKGNTIRQQLQVYNPATDTLRRRPFKGNLPPQQEDLSARQRRLQSIRSFRIDSTNTYAVLRLNSFGQGLKKQFIKKSFRQLRKKKIQHLVIDVRNNGGGLIKTSLYLTRQIQRSSFVFADSIYSRQRKIKGKATITKKLIFNLGLFFLNRKVNDSMYAFRFFRNKTYQPVNNSYSGYVYVLTGGYSFSATTLFAASVKGLDHVTIVGEETGGGYYGNNGVFIPEMILPNSKLRVRLPLYRIVNNKNYPKNGTGVLPDVEVKASAESIRENRDPKMEKALELILQQKTNN